MKINHAINLNLSASGVTPVVQMAQYDANSRRIIATLWDEASPFILPENAVVMVRFGKPDGTGGLYAQTEAGEMITYADNVVTAPVASQMLTVAGNVQADIEIYEESSTDQGAVKLATFCFAVNVMRAPHPDADIISSDYYNIVAADIAKLKASMAEVLDINAHPPQISVDGYWQTWDTENEAYKTTTYPSRGETGLQGEKGEKGDTGDIGPTGPQGPQGAQGVQGPKGEDGTSYTVKGMFATLSALQEAHPTGNAGDAWFVGSSESSVIYQWDVDQSAWVNVGSLQGPKGDKGDKGEKGDTGATGAQGPQGPKGDTGATGAIGTSAYDAARDGGYTGTEDAFNTALAGVGDKADKATGLTMTLWADDWSADTLRQTVTASGVGVNDTVIVSPAPGSWAAYNKAAVRCTAQTANALTFLCDTVPTENLMVQVLIFKGVTG